MLSHRQRIVPGFPHHIIHRGNNRRRIVSFAFDYARLLYHMVDASRVTACIVYAGAILANHLHLIVTPPDAAALARFVQLWAQRYARNRNRFREASGKLFEARYLRFPLLTSEALAAATAYVDLNPVRAGLVERPESYRWSTAALHLGRRSVDWPAELWQPSAWYLSLGEDAAARASRYGEWLAASCAREPEYAKALRSLESRHSLHYSRRLERPDGTCAREPLRDGLEDL